MPMLLQVLLHFKCPRGTSGMCITVNDSQLETPEHLFESNYMQDASWPLNLFNFSTPEWSGCTVCTFYFTTDFFNFQK